MRWVTDLALGGERELRMYETACMVRDAKTNSFSV